VVVHAPIETTSLQGSDPRDLAARVRDIVASAAETDVGVAPPDMAPVLSQLSQDH
jgi:hypothetical protein